MPQETLGTMIDLVGFVLLGVSGATAFLCLVIWRSRQARQPIVFGGSLFLFFMTTLVMTDRLLPVWTTISAGTREAIAQALGSFAYLSGAFTLNAVLKRFVWFGSLREGNHSKVPNILIGLTSLGIYAGTLMLIAAQVFHRDITAVAATSGVLAIVLGYSAQPTLSEVFAGLALNISRPFRTGDSVQVDGVWGVIVESNWRSVSLRTYEGTLVVLPNTKAASLRLTNMDHPTHDLRHHIPFVIDIEVPPGQVKAVAMAAMEAQPHVLKTPKPMVLFKNVTDQGMAYEAIFWHHDPNVYILRRDEIGHALWYAFNRAGIPFSVNRRLQAMPDGAIAPAAPVDLADYRRRLSEILHRAPLFQGFPEEALTALVEHQHRQLYGAGERLMRQGEPGSSMFVILDGRVSVLLENADGVEQEIYTLGPGQAIGHMSLMTGAPRFASVRASSHLVVAEIDKSAIAPLITAYPGAIDIVAKEIMVIDEAFQEIKRREAANGVSAAAEHAGLLDRLSDRIHAFFAPLG